jgi:hypothetical protein
MKKLRLLMAGALSLGLLVTPAVALAEDGPAPVLRRLGQVLAESTDKANSSSDKSESSDDRDSFDKLFEAELRTRSRRRPSVLNCALQNLKLSRPPQKLPALN